MLPNLLAFVGHAQLEFLPAASVGILFVGIVAAVVGLIIARLEGAAASIATLGLLVIVNSLIVGARDVTRGSRALYGIPLLVGTWTAFGFAIVAVLAARLFRGSRAGLELRAARAVGVHVARRPLKIAGGD